LLPKQYDLLLGGLQRRNWMRLAESLQMYDPNVVHEFYANAWAREDGTQDLGSEYEGDGYLLTRSPLVNSWVTLCS